MISSGLHSDPETDLRLRGNLAELERQLHHSWDLGRNLILAWCPQGDGLQLLVVPHFTVAEYGAAAGMETGTGDSTREFIAELLSGGRCFTERQMRNAAHLLGTEPRYITLRQPLGGGGVEHRAIEAMIKRHSVSLVHHRAVALFDIVGFSLLNPFQQMTQLNSLLCSLNAAHSHLLGRHVLVDFARSNTGDGFYIWNRDTGLEANVNLYHFMHLVLADNAIARHKLRPPAVPLLRTSFHIGSCYEFHHAEGLNPTVYSDIVGDVTIDLARMISAGLPGQILVGTFHLPCPASEDGTGRELDSAGFIEHAQRTLAQLNGIELSGEAIASIKCYLTGRALANGTFSVREMTIRDKHGRPRRVHNAKVNIYRRGGVPILLGIEDRLLSDVNTLL